MRHNIATISSGWCLFTKCFSSPHFVKFDCWTHYIFSFLLILWRNFLPHFLFLLFLKLLPYGFSITLPYQHCPPPRSHFCSEMLPRFTISYINVRGSTLQLSRCWLLIPIPKPDINPSILCRDSKSQTTCS